METPNRQRLRITCVIHSLAGGGAERVMAGLASRLSQRDGREHHHVTLITLGDGSGDRHSVADQVHRVDLDVMTTASSRVARARAWGRRVRALRAAVIRSRPDVVLAFCDSINVLTLLALRGTGIPVVVAERSHPGRQSLGTVGDWLRRRLYAKAAKVVAQTESQAAHLRAATGRAIEVIPSAVDAVSVVPDRMRNAQIILGVGRLEPEKGFDRLLRAFAWLVDETADTRLQLRIVGEGSQRDRYEKLASELGIAGRVAMPGWLRPLDPEYERADFFVLPSRYEGFPSALLEAMAWGLPCVATDCDDGPRHIIRHGSDGLLVHDSVDGITGGLATLFYDAELRSSLSRAATDVSQRFGWDALVQRFERVLTAAASSQHAD